MTNKAKADGTTDYTKLIGVVFLAVALVFVWRSFYAMRIPQGRQDQGGLTSAPWVRVFEFNTGPRPGNGGAAGLR